MENKEEQNKEDQNKESWRDRRKKSYDWKRLIIMTLALVAIFILINRLNKVGQTPGEHKIEFVNPDSSNTAPGDSV
jgi:hypothetical protein